jgi:hypothetical protein
MALARGWLSRVLLAGFVVGCSAQGSGDTETTCDVGQTDCNGVCVSVGSDILNCGTCGLACAAGQICSAGLCTCSPGHAACGGQCVDVTGNAQNCGGCGMACTAGQQCLAGSCQCQAGLTNCGGQCTSVTGDGANCGACGTVCAPGLVCAAGSCVSSCPAGSTQCGTSCVDVSSNPLNCGACGTTCASPMSCMEGSCACPAGRVSCAGGCVDPLSDPSNCGACGAACTGGSACSNGVCTGGTGGTGGVGGTGGTGTGGTSTGGTSTGGTSTGGTSTGGVGTGGVIVNPGCPGSAAQAYQGTVGAIPGTIEAENFDPAGYSDTTTGNEGGAYRTDVDVDIKSLGAGYAIGWMMAGEWLEYTVSVAVAGDYTLTVRAGAVDSGRTLQFSECGTSLIGPVAIPQIAAWGDMATTTAGTVHLVAGLQVIRVTVGASDYVDFDSFTLTQGAAGTGGSGGTGGSTGGTGGATGGTGGATGGTGGTGGTSCGVPTTFHWSSTGPLISAGSGLTGLKDPTVFFFNDRWNVYASSTDTSGNYNSVYLNFTDWNSAGSATQTRLQGGVAPEVFYFAPQNLWYRVYEWPDAYSTTTDPTNPQSWSATRTFYASEPAIVTQNKGSGGWIDFWVICDSANCYLFFSDDNGHLYRARTPIGSFPTGFDTPVIVMEDSTPSRLFEACNVYSMPGTGKYLLLIEAYDGNSGGRRYFRSWTASALDGTWTPLQAEYSTSFASAANVTFTGTAWTRDISHGEMLRSGYDQKLEIDTCNLQYIYQGKDPNASGDYNTLPWKLGLLTATN